MISPMRQWKWIIVVGIAALLSAFGLQSGRVLLLDIFIEPFRVFAGSQAQLNAKLIDVSETTEFTDAGRRLLQPLGALNLVRIYPTPENDTAKKH